MDLADELDARAATEPLEARLQSLFDELATAIQWARPSILIAIYRSELVRQMVQDRLGDTLGRLGHPISPYYVTKTNYDIPLELRDHKARRKTVFFIRGLRWGGGRGHSNAYRALNMHREYLVEAGLRAVLWLTPLEARQLPRYAPDFWAFRHRFFEFLDYPPAALLEDGGMRGEPREVYLACLTAYEQAPGQLPRLLDLARVCARLGFYEEALVYFRMAARRTPEDPALLEQTAQAYLAVLRPDAAAALLRKISRGGRDNRWLWSRVGQVYEKLGLLSSARRAFASAGSEESNL